MLLLIAFAFLAGIVTVLSPCILPVLPIVLSSSVGGGKKRPLGVVSGFILSFTFFTLFLSLLVRTTGISPDVLRTISIIVITVFGFSLLIPEFQVIVEKLFTKLSNNSPRQQQQAGYWGGVAIGLSLGLLWTPCVGPILASIISLALTGSVTGTAVFITLAYSFGTAIPMLAITYGGRQLLGRVPWLVSHTAVIQKAFGILMIVTAIGIYFNVDRKVQTFILQQFPQYGVGLTAIEDNETVKKQLQNLQNKPIPQQDLGKPMFNVLHDNLGTAPDFIAGGQWFNLPAGTKTLTLSELRGKVVLVDFWTYTCINCIRTLPYIRTWYEKYKDNGLVIVGVHTPEFEFEKNPENVKKALADFKLTYPVMQDNNYATWRAYDNHYWPAKYLIDKTGKVRYTHFGEGGYDETEEAIQLLLKETGATVSATINNPSYQVMARTPELYLGYGRLEYLASPEPVKPDTLNDYTAPNALSDNYFAYRGKWNIGEERAMPTKGAQLQLNFEAGEVFLVMRPKTGTSGQVKVSVDGQSISAIGGEDVKNGVVTVDADRLYKLIKLPRPGRHLLRLDFLDDNLELFAFTFG